jgi:nicotinamide riboside transporter PnuC
MTKLLLVIVATGGMLAIGWFVWRAIEAQEAASPDDTTDRAAEAEDESSGGE